MLYMPWKGASGKRCVPQLRNPVRRPATPTVLGVHLVGKRPRQQLGGAPPPPETRPPQKRREFQTVGEGVGAAGSLRSSWGLLHSGPGGRGLSRPQ